MNESPAAARPVALPWRIAAAWTLGFVALSFAGWMGERSVAFFGDGSRGRYFLQALIMSGMVVPGPIFNTHFLRLNEWMIVVGLALIPAVSEEITKFFLRMRNA